MSTNEDIARYRSNLQGEVDARIAKRFGPDVVAPTLRTLEEIDRDHYDAQPESRVTLMPAQERSHARVLRP